MRARSYFRLLAGALCVGAATRSAAAQGAMQNAKSNAMQSEAPTAASSARVVASYHITSRDHAMPERVTVTETAGRLSATYWLKSDTTAYPMGVIIYGDDLVLVGDTPRGVLELQFYGGNDSKSHGRVNGRWSRNDAESGAIRGHVNG